MYLAYFPRYLGLLVPVRLHRLLKDIRMFRVLRDLACHGRTHLLFAGLMVQRVPLAPGKVVLVDPDFSEEAGG